ncbi:hypothetical protein BD410DRAFT_813702 [Rickenella mellea]|uniref:Nucleoporin Nup133/Nup155-like C-terminal domain-containing protein n=1 Tax=Rickenella mellea TaxID=50990 RepID=A0A4Y7QD57_9AGAM|nr:hypothetical protein BD410DRAFT_813702 [Rickenella mellea]
MQVDEESVISVSGRTKGTVLFAKSAELTVTFHALVPMEVRQVLRTADFTRDAFTGDVDTSTGYSLIASSETCFVWQHAQNLLGTPTCYIFPCPTDYPHAAPPFASLVSFGTAREPALVLLSPAGELRFWDSIGLGLTGGEHTDSSQLELVSSEIITSLTRAEAQTFITSTTHGRLFLLSVSSTSGKFHVTHHPFTLSRPQSAIARLRFWAQVDPLYSGGNINAVTVGARHSDRFEVWVCVDTNIARWTVMSEGWEQLDFELEASTVISPGLYAAFPSAETDDGIFDLELVDICSAEATKLVLLVSFAGRDDDSGIDKRPRRLYAVVRLSYDADELKVEGVHTVPYQTISADRANIHPRLRLLHNGTIYCMQFGDAIVLVAKDSEYTEYLPLRSLQDRTFGCGDMDEMNEMLIMNSTTLMKVQIDQEKVAAFDAETGRASLVKSTMTQAILYGSIPENPLLFSFTPDVDEESLISGAEQLSYAVLSSDVEVVRPTHDLTRQFIERKERLKFLIGFINENGVLGKMSQSSRQCLESDAEKLWAAQQLWLEYSDRISSGHPENLLSDAVVAFMEDLNEGYHEDIMRAFFRLQTRELGSLLPYVWRLTQETLSTWDETQKVDDPVPSANRIVLSVLQSAWDYRSLNAGVYGIVLPFSRPWTSAPPLVDILTYFFDETAKLLDQNSTSDSQQTAPQEVREQLPQLASAVFKGFQERLSWLESDVAADEPGSETQKRETREKFQQARLPILQTLLKNEHAQAAFKLAEEYRDFRSLTELCHSSHPIFPPHANPYALRIQSYIEKFKEEFTTELYQWYIEHAELRSMFAQSDVYSTYIDAFFSKNAHPAISWIHDLEKGRWGTASHTLLLQANHTPDLSVRHVMLSIGKLSQLAQLSENEAAVEEPSLDVFHDGLDYISVHLKLIDELKESLSTARQKQSLESQVDAIVKTNATKIGHRHAFLTIFKRCVKDLLQGRVLSVEDIVDVLTLKDKPTDQSTALTLIKNTKDVPEARRLAAYRTAWRRIFIHDDWNAIRKTAHVTDGQLIAKFRHTALYTAVADQLSGGVDQFNANLLTPEQAAVLPTMEELTSRWPGYSNEQIAELMRSHEMERTTLLGLELDYVFDRVKELAILNAPS